MIRWLFMRGKWPRNEIKTFSFGRICAGLYYIIRMNNYCGQSLLGNNRREAMVTARNHLSLSFSLPSASLALHYLSFVYNKISRCHSEILSLIFSRVSASKKPQQRWQWWLWWERQRQRHCDHTPFISGTSEERSDSAHIFSSLLFPSLSSSSSSSSLFLCRALALLTIYSTDSWTSERKERERKRMME